MFFEGRGMQQRTKIYKIPNLKPSKKHCQFQSHLLLDFEVIWGPIYAPFGHAQTPFAEKPDSRDIVIFVRHPWGCQNVLLA